MLTIFSTVSVGRRQRSPTGVSIVGNGAQGGLGGQNGLVPYSSDDRDFAPGWDAIDAAISPFVGDAEQLHWGTGTALPGQGGIWGISGYDLSDHWFFITYGLSDLFTKTGGDPDISLWGEELTMRVSRQTGDVPIWPVNLLARLGEIVFQREQPFMPGGRLEIPDAIGEIPPAVAWTVDPLIPPFKGEFGAVTPVATLGISSETLDLMRTRSTAVVVEEILVENPRCIVGQAGLIW